MAAEEGGRATRSPLMPGADPCLSVATRQQGHLGPDQRSWRPMPDVRATRETTAEAGVRLGAGHEQTWPTYRRQRIQRAQLGTSQRATLRSGPYRRRAHLVRTHAQ